LRSHGVNTVETAFNNAFKNKIYHNLRDLMSYPDDPELWLYEDHRLLLEMKNLKYRKTKRGVTFMPDRAGDVKTDDIIDCLAGASAMATDSVYMALPQPVLVRTGWR